MPRTRLAQLILCSLLVITFMSAIQLPDLRFHYDFDAFYPVNDQATDFFTTFKDTFGSDNDFALIALQNDKGIFDKKFLSEVHRLTIALDTLPFVQYVRSPTTIKKYNRNLITGTITQSPFLHWQDSSRYEADSLQIYKNPLLIDNLFSRDRKSILIYIRNQNFLDQKGCRAFADRLNSLLAEYSFHKTVLGGKCIGQSFYVDTVENEAKKFISAGVILVVFLLWFSYRKLWGIWIPLGVVAMTVIWTTGIMILTGKSIDFIANIIPTVLLVIGISDAIHLLTNYLQRNQSPTRRWSSIKSTIKEVGSATLLTTFTTAIGFLTLTTSKFAPLIDLGIYCTIGLVLAFLTTYLFIPSVLILSNGLVAGKNGLDAYWKPWLSRLWEKIVNSKRTVIVVSTGLFLFGLMGISQLKVNNYVLDDIGQDHPLREDFNFIAEKFAGGRPFELVIHLKDKSKSIYDLDVLNEISLIDSFLYHDYGVSTLISPAIIMSHANQAYHRGNTDYFIIPSKQTTVNLLSKRIAKSEKDIAFQKMVSNNKKWGHINGKIPDWGSRIIRKKNKDFFSFIQHQIPNSTLDYTLTGAAHLMDLNNQYLAENILLGLAIAIGIIAILFAYLFKDLSMLWVTLVPNLLPLIIVGGVMGFLGIDLKISTSIIFIISFGVAVDDSIHFLSRFRQELSKNPPSEALRITFMNTGKAIVITTVILVSGFMTLCLSSFMGTFYIGVLVSLTLVLALMADLTLLPVLLLLKYRKK